MPATDTRFPALDSLRQRYLDSPVPAWLRLAGDTVLDTLPAGLRRLLGAQPRMLLLRVDGADLQLLASVDGQASAIGRVPVDDPELLATVLARLDAEAADVPRWLLVDAGQVLRRVIVLPASAESRLRDVLTHEVDRQTPFALDQVVFESRVLSRDPVGKQIRVELVVLPMARLQDLLAAVGPLAPGLAGIDVREPDGTRLGVNLLPSLNRGVRMDRATRLNLMLGAGIAVVLFLAMWLALGNRSAALADLQDRVKAARADAGLVRGLRNELGSSVQAANFLAKQRAQQPTLLEVINDLTTRIPDDTVLDKISFNEGRVVLVGGSRQATALVELLGASSLLRRPALVGAMQPDPRTGMDRFTLTATIVGSPQEVADGKSQQAP